MHLSYVALLCCSVFILISDYQIHEIVHFVVQIMRNEIVGGPEWIGFSPHSAAGNHHGPIAIGLSIEFHSFLTISVGRIGSKDSTSARPRTSTNIIIVNIDIMMTLRDGLVNMHIIIVDNIVQVRSNSIMIMTGLSFELLFLPIL